MFQIPSQAVDPEEISQFSKWYNNNSNIIRINRDNNGSTDNNTVNANDNNNGHSHNDNDNGHVVQFIRGRGQRLSSNLCSGAVFCYEKKLNFF